jgi:DNA-binding NarL/FixJ family response regulator
MVRTPLSQQPQIDEDHPRILLVDDHDQVRAALYAWLRAALPHFAYLEAASGEEAIRLAIAHHPCLVIIDIALPGMSGIDAAGVMLKYLPELKVVVLSIHDEACYRDDAARVGVSAFVSKSNMRTQLFPALLHALSTTTTNRI